MANPAFLIRHQDYPGNADVRVYVIADTDANKPATAWNSAGDLMWVKDTRQFYVADGDLAWQRISRQIFSQQVRVTYDAAVGSSTETSLLGAGTGSATLPASWFQTGRSLRVEASGLVESALASTATLTIRIKKGSTVIASSGAVQLLDGWLGTRWALDCLIVGRSTTSVYCTAHLIINSPNGDASNPPYVTQMPAYTGSLPTGLTTVGTSSEAIGLTAQWASSVLGNETITCDAFTLTDN